MNYHCFWRDCQNLTRKKIGPNIFYSWWFQPIWKIYLSNWIIFPGIRVKIKNVWNHDPDSWYHGNLRYPPKATPPINKAFFWGTINHWFPLFIRFPWCLWISTFCPFCPQGTGCFCLTSNTLRQCCRRAASKSRNSGGCLDPVDLAGIASIER